MQTLASYQYLDSDLILQGVYDWLFEESGGLMQQMPVREVQGNGIKYNVETTYPGATWTSTNDVIPESAGDYTQRSAAIYRLIGDIDVDKYAIKTNSQQNPELIEIKRKIRGFYHEWYDQLIHGQTTTSSTVKQPKGLLKLIAELESEATTDLDALNNSQVIAMHGTAAALTLAGMDELRDACNSPTHYIMNKWARRQLDALARAAGNNLQHDNDELGYPVTRYGDQVVLINDHIGKNFPNNSTSVLAIATTVKNKAEAADYDNTVIFCVRMKEDGFTIMQAGAMEKEAPFTVPNKDALRHRVKWYNGFGLFDKYSAAALTGVTQAL